jgi:hypothetical protein
MYMLVVQQDVLFLSLSITPSSNFLVMFWNIYPSFKLIGCIRTRANGRNQLIKRIRTENDQIILI